jgi:hypothetical protein
MKTRENWKIKIINCEMINNQLLEGMINNQSLLLEGIKNIVRTDFLGLFGSNIENAFRELSAEFIQLGYAEEDLTFQINYVIDADEDRYLVSIYAYVYPVMHPVSKKRVIISHAERYYVHDAYTKARNQEGKLVKEQIEQISIFCKLVKENEALKKRVEQLEQRIKEL